MFNDKKPTAKHNTSLYPFIYKAMKNKNFPDNEDFTTADTELTAMMDVIRATLDNCVSNLQSGGRKECF